MPFWMSVLGELEEYFWLILLNLHNYGSIDELSSSWE